MRIWIAMLFSGGVLAAVEPAIAQPPPGGPGDDRGPAGGLSRPADAEDLVRRMLAFDANKDGSLTRDEITDRRLVRLFDRADGNKDGTVTRAELTALADREHAEGGPGGAGGPGGPPGFGPPGGPGMGPGGPMMRPGEVLPAGLRRRLGLSRDQQAELDALQKEVDSRLRKILTKEQFGQLRSFAGQRGPNGNPFRRPRGPGGPPGGPPPDDGPPPR